MSFKISVTGEDISFDCEDGETVLEAAERAGYVIPYSCRKGVCGNCAGKISCGEAKVKGQGLCTGPLEDVLLCQARPISDLEIVPVRIRTADPVSRKTFEVRVRKVERPITDVAVIHLRFPIGNRAVFRAGQYLRVLMDDGDSRNYSLANPPHRNDSAELHIRHVPGGKFSQTILANLEKGATLKVELPYGEFTLSEREDQPAILIATGTGFAPIKSIVEHQIKSGGTRPMHLYWGSNIEADLYMRSLPEKWGATHPWFSFTPVISCPDKNWTGRDGLVHHAVQNDYPDMAALEVYACGAPVMINAAQKDFCEKAGLKDEAFFSDAFVPSGFSA
ncbi:MAG: 2Fe-2S iron-sulfur cluster binding domain-containing protein [Rhizobiaceae bacterium]|nr:2Fe-2S iron-sulfur cluster binding domain-containing protein [Rhizobiaceae bacterium]